MSYDIDATLEAIQQLSEQIGGLPPGPARNALEEEREVLRARARLATDATRPGGHLKAELANVEKQLANLDTAAIKPALNESYKMVTDPSAYRRRINEKIEAGSAARRAALEQRRLELLAALGEHQEDG